MTVRPAAASDREQEYDCRMARGNRPSTICLISQMGNVMLTANLEGVAEAVVSRAQRQGSVTPEEVQEELTRGGVPHELWEEVLTLCRRSLRRRQGRYHYVPAEGQRPGAQQQSVRRVVRQLIRRHKRAQRVERRGQERIDFIQPVRVVTEDNRELHLLSRDLSTSGIRLIGTRSLLGQKVCVYLGEKEDACSLMVRILWTCTVGDQMFENGGMFLEAGDNRG